MWHYDNAICISDNLTKLQKNVTHDDEVLLKAQEHLSIEKLSKINSFYKSITIYNMMSTSG